LIGHCSALIRVNGDLSDLWAAHSSWFTYGSTNRIYKHYNFQLYASFVAARQMSFSSYPGFLESLVKKNKKKKNKKNIKNNNDNNEMN